MRLNLGRIGTQESTNLIALQLAVTGIFTVESSIAYAKGNSTFLTIPLSLLLGLIFFFAGIYAVKLSGMETFEDMTKKVLGGPLSTAVMLITAFFLLFEAYLLILRFASIIHSYVFVESSYILVALWVILPVAVISLLGFETLGRMAKIFGVTLGVLFLLGFVSAVDGFETYRLYPLFGDGAGNIISETFRGSYKFIPTFIAALVLMNGMNGEKTVRKSVIVATCIAMLFCFITQIVLGLTYEYTSLKNMYFPLCRLNMSLQNEDYFMRTDKIGVFLWLTGAVISIAFYVYCAGYIFCRKTATKDIRPPIICFLIMLSSLVLAEYTKLYATIHKFIITIENYAFFVLFFAVVLVFVVSIIKSRKEKRT